MVLRLIHLFQLVISSCHSSSLPSVLIPLMLPACCQHALSPTFAASGRGNLRCRQPAGNSFM